MKKILLIFTILLMAGKVIANPDSIAAVANEQARTKRAKVGLVLCGGGAKGMAHVGVLKVLERAGIPIDVIAGTSIGSIVGGLYAIGYNAHSLDSLVKALDWGYVITDRENLTNQSLIDRKKQNTYIFTTGKAAGKRNMNAGGFIKGKNISELLQRLCSGYTDSLNFSRDLPIPFACVATNIMDNSEVVFHSGRLPQAMRASMAIPAAFTPVRMGDMVLVDGGMRNNYPADVARAMGADIVIGVTLSGKAKTAEEVKSTMSVIGQIIDMNCVNKYNENIAITDLHMNVDPKDYSTASFSSEAIDSLVRYGEEEAMRHWDEIIALKKRIGISNSFRPRILHPLRPNVMTDRQRISGYTFENMTPQGESFLRQKFHLQKIDSIDAELEQQLTTSMRIDLFYNTAECRLIPEGDGVRVVLSAGNRRAMQFHAGVRFDSEENAALQLGLDIPLKTAIPINTDFTLRLGKLMLARGEITVHPRSFTRPTFSFTFRRNDVDVYLDGDLDYNIRYNQSQAEFVPINLDLRHFTLQMGLRWDYMHYRNKLGSEISKQISLKNEHFISYRARLDYNSEDNWYFPTRGARFKAEYAYVTNNFAKLNQRADDGTVVSKVTGMSEVSANWRMSFTIGSRFTIQPMLYGRLLLGPSVPTVLGNTIGGEWFGRYVDQQMPFVGIGNMEYTDHQFVAAQLQAQQRIGRNNYVLFRMAGAQHADKIKQLLDYSTLLGGQIAYFYNSIIGPIGASIGYSNRIKSPYMFLNIGYQF